MAQRFNHTPAPIAILGAGAWGTALGLYLARQGDTVYLWSAFAEEIAELTQQRCNQRYLPGFAFPNTLIPHADLKTIIAQVSDILLVVPSIAYRHTLQALKPHLTPQHRLISASKGLEEHSAKLPSDMISHELGAIPYAILSGPSFAKEVAAGLTTAVVIASDDSGWQRTVMQRFDSPIFRTYPSTDVIGVEMGGIGKNVIAIATGISDGLNNGTNAKSALITNGLAEMARLGVAMGGQTETFMGLAGLGDLVLTASDNQSRNRRFGLALAQGMTVSQAEESIGQVVEGKRNAELILTLAQRYGVHLPICETVWAILQAKLPVSQALAHMFAV